jgi:hypothetical protein
VIRRLAPAGAFVSALALSLAAAARPAAAQQPARPAPSGSTNTQAPSGPAAGRPAPAVPSFPTADPVVRRLYALGMDSSRAAAFLQVLTDSIGPRLTGTPGLQRGHDWLVRTYSALGVPARNERVGTWKGWRRGATHVDLVAPRVRTLEGTMLAWSPGTGGRDVTAPVVLLPEAADSAAFAAWLPRRAAGSCSSRPRTPPAAPTRAGSGGRSPPRSTACGPRGTRWATRGRAACGPPGTRCR